MTFDQYIDYTFNATRTIDPLQIEKFIDLLFDAYKNQNTVFIIGNGGSAANASHLAQDLAKGTRPALENPRRIKAISLTDNIAFITAAANDDGYDTVFEQQLKTFAVPGDYVVAISGSGNSPNIVKAIHWANMNGLTTIGITGFNGGKLKELNTYSLHVELNDMCTSESIHSIVLHYVIIELQKLIRTYTAV